MKVGSKAVFFDRDGTLNPDPGYIHHPDLFTLHPWAAPALQQLQEAGFLLFVISNQSGINRGKIPPHQLELIHDKMKNLFFEQAEVELQAIRICPHRPDENCDCRKPSPKLIFDLLEEYQLSASRCFLVGDRESDIQAGERAGLQKSFLIRVDHEQDFKDAVKEILRTPLP